MPSVPTSEAVALFLPDRHRFIPTVLTQGPWDPGLQFGGAAAALLLTVVDEVPTLAPMQVARLTVDLLRPVPLRPLTACTRVVREGKKIQVVEAALLDGDTEVVRAVVLRLREHDLGAIEIAGPPAPGPLPVADRDPAVDLYGGLARTPGVAGAIDIRYVGSRAQVLTAPTWYRLKVPVVAGRQTHPMAPVAFVSDFASGFGGRLAPRLGGINADISLHLVRAPQAPPNEAWICLDGRGYGARAGIGLADIALYDESGVVGAAMLSRLLEVEPDE